MSFRINFRLNLLMPLLLVGCSTVAPVERADDPRLEQLSAGMDRCLASQAEIDAQLRRQEQQLNQQQQQLAVMTEMLEADGSISMPVTDVVPVDTSNEDCPSASDVEPESKLTVGQLEQVWLQNLQLGLTARIDTGAETASLDARNIELFERDGRRWVRFEIVHPDTGEPLPMERKLKRMVAILQASSAESERRPVIKLGITIGHISQSAEFTLSDRSHLDFQVLIGRNILKDVMVVDVSRENIAPYSLPEATADGGETAQ